MSRPSLNDLAAFMTVAEKGSFTRAAAQLGVSPSALSHAMRNLEERLGVRLLARTTRRVVATEAGERLVRALAPAMIEISQALDSLNALREKPTGTVRITTSEHAAHTILWPKLSPLLAVNPDIELEINVDNGLTDIVAQRFDAGVRLGEQIAKDMIAVRISPDLRMAAVAAPVYLARHMPPKTPQELAQHHCINLRLPTLGGLYVWEFERKRRLLKVRVDGQLVFNNTQLVLKAAAAGFGIAYVIEDYAAEMLHDGRLIRMLEDWCEPFAGYHLYYPSRRQQRPALAAVIEALRYRGHK